MGDITDKIFIDKILNNIIRSFRKHQLKKDEILDRDERLLLWNNVVLINNIC